MKKRVLIIIAVIVLAVLAFGIGEMAGMFPWQYLSKEKVESFIEDSHYTFTYDLPDAETKDEYDSILTNDLEMQMAAAAYAARSGFALDADPDHNAYMISAEELNNERSSLFMDTESSDIADSRLLTAADGGYLLHLKDAPDSLSYEITDSFYGINGSEPTSITVRYKLNEKQCELVYTLASDKDNPYSFKVVDITIRTID